jgi:glycosyltransferase XagB
VTTTDHEFLTHAEPVDLGAQPPDPKLLRSSQLADDLFRRWLPWRWQYGTLWVATCVPVTEDLRAEVTERLGHDRINFRQTSAAELARAAQQLIPGELAHEAAERFAIDNPDFSAKAGLTWWQALLPAAAVLASALGLVLDWHLTIVVLVTIANVIFLANVGFKVLAAGFRPLRSSRERKFRAAEHRRLSILRDSHERKLLHSALDRGPAAPGGEHSSADAPLTDYPVYTILVPVYQEANVIGQILHNFEQLDYPTDKLEVLVLLEADDEETIAAARAANVPSHIRLLIVPEGEPRTKPRACNYGLLFATGTYVVIYDAEDRPDPDQLKRVLVSFRNDSEVQARRSADRPLACVQASLNYYNADYNVLTRMFAIEYAQWFDSMLPGMDSVNTPIPLGGTSNHFLRSALVEVGGWDPYNVTEDADLGMRLAASGYRVDVVKSTTWEEATAKVGPWIRQRTRWIKGYILTAAVNLRHPVRWVRRNGPRASITMFGLILGTPLSFMLYPLALGFTLFAWLIGPVLQIWLPTWLLIFGLVNMVVMNLLMVISSGLAAWQRYNWRIAAFAVFLPVYWLLHAFAAWRAAFQLAYDPFGWEKTPHGLTEEYDDSILDTGGLPHSAST